ncbi:hypothetical protein BTVI_05749 [Pitangus sulphuratus]|nr:hypothetical protein BTVI_05749 [Pitangus sulphuratus]
MEDIDGGPERALEKSPFQLTVDDVYRISTVLGWDFVQLSLGPSFPAARAQLQFRVLRVLEMLEALLHVEDNLKIEIYFVPGISVIIIEWSELEETFKDLLVLIPLHRDIRSMLFFGGPTMDTALQVGSHKSGLQRQNHISRPTLFDAAQDMVGFLGCKCTLPVHV